MSDLFEDSWHIRLSQKRANCPSEAARRITTEPQFRIAFEDICEERQEFDHSRLEANILWQVKTVIAFAADIDTIASLEPPDNVTGVLFTYLFAVIQVVWPENDSIAHFLKDFRSLNRAFPKLDPSKLPRFPRDESVQRRLQNLFLCLISYYEMIIADHFSTAPAPFQFKSTFARLSAATAIFENAKAEWERSLIDAAELEDARQRFRAQQATEPQPRFREEDSDSFRGGARTNVHFKDLRWLGNGGYGSVFEATEQITGQVYARKELRARSGSHMRATMDKHVRNEVTIMQKLRHHHIASVSFWSRDLDVYSIFMLPVAEYDLRVFLEQRCTEQNFPEDVISVMDSWFGCLISALTYAHNEHIKHEDIKPANILIKQASQGGYTAYLSDFGSAKDFSELGISTMGDQEWAGTPVYYAPENRPWGRRADVFALGCVFSEMVTVRLKKSLHEYREFRKQPDVRDQYAYWRSLPKVGVWLDRLSAIAESNHPEHLRYVVAKIKLMIHENVEKRPDARVVKRSLHKYEYLFCESCA